MNITDASFNAVLTEEFSAALADALKAKTDTFTIDYTGGDGTPAGAQEKMTCLVILWPTELAELMAEGLQVVKSNLIQVAEAELLKRQQQKNGTIMKKGDAC